MNIENKVPFLIVMLTYNDMTVKNAYEIFEKCKKSRALYWGFKDDGLSPNEMKKLFSYMKQCGKITVLEAVSYNEKDSLRGAKLAVDCGCDILMGTVYYESVNDICKKNGIKYMPFVGDVKGRPSQLSGSAEKMIEHANELMTKGVFGFDLLAYRYDNDSFSLIEKFVRGVPAPVCVAGSINSFERIDEVMQTSAWAFTIGGAFFDNCFGDDFCSQVDRVCEYIESKAEDAVKC